MSKIQKIMVSKWSLALLLAGPGYLVGGCDAEEVGAEDIETRSGEIQTDILRLGQKWQLSGIGDAHGNDEWLRQFNIQGTDYWGGFATGKLWSISGGVSGSDIRLKTDIKSLSNSLDKLIRLRGVQFRWKHDQADREIGMIAQEVESVFPELVEVGPDGLEGIKYDGLSAVMVEAMKEQQAQIANLQDELLDVRDELRSLQGGMRRAGTFTRRSE